MKHPYADQTAHGCEQCGMQSSAQETIKSARWMPWLRMAKKDAIGLRYAPGRRHIAFDPEISE